TVTAAGRATPPRLGAIVEWRSVTTIGGEAGGGFTGSGGFAVLVSAPIDFLRGRQETRRTMARAPAPSSTGGAVRQRRGPSHAAGLTLVLLRPPWGKLSVILKARGGRATSCSRPIAQCTFSVTGGGTAPFCFRPRNSCRSALGTCVSISGKDAGIPVGTHPNCNGDPRSRLIRSV